MVQIRQLTTLAPMVALPSASQRQQQSSEGHSRRFPPWALDVGVGCFVVCAFVIFITAPLKGDPMVYLSAAQDPFGSELNHWTARLLVLLPTSVVSLVFGFSEVTLYVIPLLFVFILGTATSALGRLIFRPSVGAGAALVAASGPIILPYGTQLLPDVGAAALITASLVFLYRASENRGATSHHSAVLAGLLFGCAYLIRETSLIFAPAFLVSAWILNVRDKRLLLMMLGALVAPAVEIPAGWILWGEPFPRVVAALGHGGPVEEVAPRHINSVEAQMTYLDSLGIFVGHLWRSLYGQVILIGSAAFAVIAALTRNRRYVALAAWIVLAWASFAAAGTVGLTGRLIIRLLLDRYWAFMMPALAVAALGTVALALEQVVRRYGHKSSLRALAALLAVGLIMLGGAASFDARGGWFMRFGNHGYEQLRSTLASMPSGAKLYVAGEFEDLTRLQTVGAFGQQTADIQIVSAGEDPEFLLIPETDLTSDSIDLRTDSSTPGGFKVPISDAYRLFAAEEMEPEWVLLTSLDDQASQAQALLEIGVNGVEWRGRKVAEGIWHDAVGLDDKSVSIASNERLIGFESTARYGQPNSSSPVNPGALIEFRAPLIAVDGTIHVVCQFHDTSGSETRRDVRALSVLQGDHSGGQLTAFCRVPLGHGDQVMRPVLVVTGPAALQIGGGRLLVHEQT